MNRVRRNPKDLFTSSLVLEGVSAIFGLFYCDGRPVTPVPMKTTTQSGTGVSTTAVRGLTGPWGESSSPELNFQGVSPILAGGSGWTLRAQRQAQTNSE